MEYGQFRSHVERERGREGGGQKEKCIQFLLPDFCFTPLTICHLNPSTCNKGHCGPEVHVNIK